MPGGFSRRFRFLRFPPGGFGVGVLSFRGRSVVSRWVGVLVLIPAVECQTPTPIRPGAKQGRTRRAGQPGEARLLNRPFRDLFFRGSHPGAFSRCFRFLRFPPGGFGVGVSSFRGRSVFSRRVGVLVLIPAGGCWAPTPTQPGTKQRRTRRASQPGEARPLNRPIGGWLFGWFPPGGLFAVVSFFCVSSLVGLVLGCPPPGGGLWFRVGLVC